VDAVADPTWIDGSDGDLFGWIHRPADGGARGSVVLCPPLGREHLSSYRAIRRLADSLAASGFLALRFDYRGTGDSAGGVTRTSQVPKWIASVAEAADFAAKAAVGPVFLVGLRLGATLAVEAISRIEAVDAVVLWDPCPSPAAFLREQHLLHRLSSGRSERSAQDGNWLDTPGMTFSAETVEDLRALSWSHALAGSLGARMGEGTGVLLLSRSDEPLSPALQELSDHRSVRLSEVVGQRELLETSTLPGAVPASTLDQITSYISGRAPLEARRSDVRIRPSASIRDGDGDVVVERAVRLGPEGLFGIVTEPPGAKPAGPPVLLLTVAAHHHVGPSRQWVELARTWAAQGARVVRFDVSGVGDSGADSDGPKAYTARSVADIVAAARASSPEAPGDVVLFGMCSGAWAASLAGTELAARAVYLLNQDRWNDGDETSSGPAETFRRLRDGGVAVTVVVGPDDAEALEAALSPAERHELFGTGDSRGTIPLRYVSISDLDHDLLTQSGCRALTEQLSPLVLASCGLPPMPFGDRDPDEWGSQTSPPGSPVS